MITCDMAPDNVHQKKCNTFVFLDLETTGLIGREADGGRTKITEVCFVGISRDTFTKVRDDLPRVLHKLSFPVNPMKKIPETTFNLTGLNNELLNKEFSFDEEKAALVGCFLRQLPQPVCLVAHNGFRFDFPLLKEALPNIPDTTCCMDTLWTFRDIFHQPDVDGTFRFNPFPTEIDHELMRAADKCERNYTKSVGDVDTNLMRMLNETTPISQKIAPKDVNIKKKKLFVDDENSCDGVPSISTCSRPIATGMPNFSLHNVHIALLGEKPQSAHRAEDDVLSMIKCCLRCGPRVLENFDQNAQLFSNVRRIYFD